MTAPMGNTGRDASATTTSSQSTEQNIPRGFASTNSDDGNSSPHANGRPTYATEGGEHPELDAFIKGFYDGDKFTDVDSRVWV